MPHRRYDMGQQVRVRPLPLFDTHTEYVGVIYDYRASRRTWLYEIEQPDGTIERSVAQDRLLPVSQEER